MTIPETLTELRKIKKLTRASVAKSIGVTRTTLWRWEKGSTIPTLDYAEKWANALDFELSLTLNRLTK